MNISLLIEIVIAIVSGFIVELIVDKNHRVTAIIAIGVILLLTVPATLILSSHSKIASSQNLQNGTSGQSW